jgi:hypothetical protein
MLTLRCVDLVKPLGLFCSLPYRMYLEWALYALWTQCMCLGGACEFCALLFVSSFGWGPIYTCMLHFHSCIILSGTALGVPLNNWGIPT